MTITLTINNPYYASGLQEMAASVGIPVEKLCQEMITKRVEDFVEPVKIYKRNTVQGMIAGRKADDRDLL